MLSRLLFFLVLLGLLPLVRRALVLVFRGFATRPAAAGHQCPRCGGSGWLAAGEGMQRACGCGATPSDTRGPTIDIPEKDRTVG